MLTTGSHNGHPIPTVNGTGFENGAKVLVTSFDYDHCDSQFAEQQREIGRREVIVDIYQVMRGCFDWIFEDPNIKLAADAYRFAAGTTAESEVEIAAKYGVRKATVSKRVKQWQEFLNLPPAAAMRTDKACETFKRETLKSWKKRRQKPAKQTPQQTLLQTLQVVPV